MDNPYVGTEWEQSWQQGHDAGLAQPTGVVEHPMVIEPGHLTVFDEGALAGQSDAAQGGTPIEIDPLVEPEPESSAKLTATLVFSAAELALEGLAEGWIGAAVHILIDISIPSGAPPQDLSDPAELSSTLHTAVAQMGAAELFMAFCQNSDHSAVGDEVTSSGYWHSNVFTDYWAAYPVAVDHLSAEPDSQGRVGMVHVTADSDGAEWIEIV